MANITTIGRIGGMDVRAVDLSEAGGIRVRLLSWGARLAELWVPDRLGQMADIVLGCDSPADWQDHGAYLGATCGRYANRISQGSFVLDGKVFQVDLNEEANHLHGGSSGFDRKHWQIESHSDRHVTFAASSPDGEMGYPGNLDARVTYRIEAAELHIEMTARSDRPTIVNLVNHAYFNLAGHGSGTVMNHELRIEAGFFLPVDGQQIPTGEVASVGGTAFDFRTLRPIGQMLPGDRGFDHNFCLSAPTGPGGLRPCLEARDPVSGRRLRLATTEPGVQIYTGAHFSGTPGKAGARYPRFAGLAVETQRFPDSPNNPHFPSSRLDPGMTYSHQMRLTFSAE